MQILIFAFDFLFTIISIIPILFARSIGQEAGWRSSVSYSIFNNTQPNNSLKWISNRSLTKFQARNAFKREMLKPNQGNIGAFDENSYQRFIEIWWR